MINKKVSIKKWFNLKKKRNNDYQMFSNNRIIINNNSKLGWIIYFN